MYKFDNAKSERKKNINNLFYTSNQFRGIKFKVVGDGSLRRAMWMITVLFQQWRIYQSLEFSAEDPFIKI